MGETSTTRVGSGLTTALTYAAWGAVVAPLTIVAHELGHFGVGLFLATPDLALHYGSVSDTASEQGVPAVRIGAQALAGPVATLLIMAACVMGLRQKVHPFFVVTLIAAPIRFAVGAVYLAFSLQAAIQGGARGEPNFDEFKAAQALGFAVEPLLIGELVATIAIWVWMFRRLQRETRFSSLFGAVVGIGLGIGVWIALIGPWLLP